MDPVHHILQYQREKRRGSDNGNEEWTMGRPGCDIGRRWTKKSSKEKNIYFAENFEEVIKRRIKRELQTKV